MQTKEQTVLMPDLAEQPARPLVLQPQTGDGWLSVVERMLEKGIDADTLEKVLAMKMQMQENQAKEEFGRALAGFQSELPMIMKDRAVHGKKKEDGSKGPIMYYFADYSDIRSVTRPLHTKYALAANFPGIKHQENPKTQFGELVGACRLRVGGYFEDYSFVMAVPKGLNTNQSQDYIQAVTYFKRGAYCAALDIITTDRDYDGANLTALISTSQMCDLEELIKERGVDLKKFLKWATEAAKSDVESLEAMPLSIFEKAIDLLRRKPMVKGGKSK